MNSIVKEQNLEKQVKNEENEDQIEPLNILKEKLAIKIDYDKQKDTTEKQIGDLEQLRFVFDNLSSILELTLLLQSSNIGSSFCFQIFDSLMNLTNLEYLLIEIKEDNQIENENLIYLGKVLSSLQNIIQFSITICSKGNNIEWDDQITPFYQSIKTLQQLECLSIKIQFDYNPLTNDKAPNLIQLFHNVKCLSKLKNLTIEFKNYAQFYSISHLTSLKEMLFSLKNTLKIFNWKTEKDQILLKTNQSLFLDCLLQLTHLQTFKLKEKIKSPLYKLPRLVSLLTAPSGGFKFW